MVFGGENDVTRLTAKFRFQVMAKQLNNLERVLHDRSKFFIFLEKLNCLRRYSILKCTYFSENSNKVRGK